MAKSIFDLENPRSMSWPKFNQVIYRSGQSILPKMKEIRKVVRRLLCEQKTTAGDDGGGGKRRRHSNQYKKNKVTPRVGVNSGVGVGVGFNSNSNSGVGIGVETSGVGVGVDIQETCRSWSWSWNSRSWSWSWYSGDLPELELELELKPPELELELIFWRLAGVGVGVGVETSGVGVGVDIMELTPTLVTPSILGWLNNSRRHSWFLDLHSSILHNSILWWSTTSRFWEFHNSIYGAPQFDWLRSIIADDVLSAMLLIYGAP